MTSVWPLKCEFVSLLRWLKQAECSVHFTIKKYTNIVSMVPHANWHHSTARQSEHTKYSTYQQQSNGSKCSYGEWRWQPNQNLLNSVFIPYMSASVIECRSIGSCSSSGLCAGLMITGFHFQYSHCLPLTQNASKGYENGFQEPVL